MKQFLIVTLFAFAVAHGQEMEALPGAPEMAGALVKQHGYLFGAPVSAEADASNRDWQEIQQASRRATSEEQKAEVATRRAAAADALVKLLESCPEKYDLAFTGMETTLPPLAPARFPGDSAAFLFRVATGDGPARCLVLDFDLSEHSHLPQFPVEVAPGCTTWVLVSLRRLPQLTTHWSFEFRVAGLPTTSLPLTLKASDHGTLKLSVLSDDDGKVSPAMIRLTWKTDGSDVRPGGALDFSPQFDKQGNHTGARRANLPGKLAGAYWCIPGAISMSVAPGEYDVVVLRGVEHVAVYDTVTVPEGGMAERTYRPRRWVNMPKAGWYSGDDHVHSQILSDADADATMTWIQAEDVHLANVVKMGDINRTWFEQRGFGKNYRVIDGDYILSPGQECPRTHNELGHTLAMNIKNMIRDTDRYYLYDTVFDEVHRQGGLSGYAHVNAGLFHVHRDMSMNIPKEKIDFVELLQFADMSTDLYYEFLNTGFPVTASAGSDVPWGGTVGEVRVFAYVGKKRFTADRWFEAVRRGNTFVTNGIMLDFTVDGALPGDTLKVGNGDSVRVKARAWGDPERDVPSKLDVMVHGAAVKTVESSDPRQAELAIEFELPAANGFWIAARAEGADGSRAHTTPVYVIRDGLRFWKYDALDELIAKREASLAEIEQIVAEATQGNSPRIPMGPRPAELLAQQGPALLERVEAAKAIYAELRAAKEAEAALRE
ncbi:MAG: hypothetical protein AMXMBFR84_06200 [Candidatus Hydrogenedentota bacterium]